MFCKVLYRLLFRIQIPIGSSGGSSFQLPTIIQMAPSGPDKQQISLVMSQQQSVMSGSEPANPPMIRLPEKSEEHGGMPDIGSAQ